MHSTGFFEPHEILDLASGLLGDHPYRFAGRTTGARPQHLAAVRKRLHRFLAYNPGWRFAADTIFCELGSGDSLSIEVFNPLNFFGLLNDLYLEGSSQRIPSMLLHRQHADGRETIYRGELLWTAEHGGFSAEQAVRASYPGEKYFALRSANQWLNAHDQKLSRLYGLTYEVVRESEGRVSLLHAEDGCGDWRETASFRKLQDFVDDHRELVVDVGKYFARFFVGNFPRPR